MEHKTQTITDLLTAYLRETGLEQPLLERRLLKVWPEVVGPMAEKLTSKLEIRNGVLYAYVRSAALKAQLFEYRFDLVRRLNETVGGKVIHDIRLLG